MNTESAFRWAVRYLVWKILFVVGGGVLVGGSVAYAVYPVYRALRYGAPFPGTAILVLGGLAGVLGLLVWQIGTIWAFYRTLTGAVAEEISETYDTEKVKSDILSVLDGRIADLQSDVDALDRTLQETTTASSEEDYRFEDEA